jgi:hypothetical protein
MYEQGYNQVYQPTVMDVPGAIVQDIFKVLPFLPTMPGLVARNPFVPAAYQFGEIGFEAFESDILHNAIADQGSLRRDSYVEDAVYVEPIQYEPFELPAFQQAEFSTTESAFAAMMAESSPIITSESLVVSPSSQVSSVEFAA